VDILNAGLFLLFVVAGAYVQTITGFAMGLVIMGGVTMLDLAPVAFSAGVVSLLSMVNTCLALRYSSKHIDWNIVRQLCIGLFPAMLLGIFVLDILSDTAYIWLRRLLGFVIILAGTLLILKPEPWKNRSGKITTSLFGVAGGLIGGMFSAGGPPLAFMMYRQPLDLNTIRATLLATFLVSTSGRTGVIVLDGQMTYEMMTVGALAIPLVLLTTIYARKVTPDNSEMLIRRFVFVLLILIGATLLLT
jgi:uncharacterized membrane protein YfcA